MDVYVKIVETVAEKESVLSIRRDVFIRGLNIPKHIEIDENENNANYVLATVGETPVGTARWRKTDEGIKLERFAVLDGYRSMGVGRIMTEFIINQFSGNEHIYLNSQDTAIGFYEKLGFESVGPMFQEAGIQHQKMVYPKGE
ncbi:MAG: GNAT family N-acetyltransferase [Candidatus Marinimicrobia bacterium]|jgi:predicted GNAT family N-acyltransferase|nr:GNAT family N-acetyltransferase [Candidatus Neomarinimicrobiota bacterium]MDP6610832.1 GNAT family N-acetyltransferase [Candidatus Neomarinimicrobiota bacterium]|tara:strand:+ start:1918 stop:2346 length:429 start_codon:yes stop_codon:yes gene_type:complete